MIGENYTKKGIISDSEDPSIGIIPRSISTIFEFINQKKLDNDNDVD